MTSISRARPSFFIATVSILLAAIGCQAAKPVAPMPVCRGLANWVTWLHDLGLTQTWSGITERAQRPDGIIKRLNSTAELATLERIPAHGVCECCTILLIRNGLLESIRITRMARSSSEMGELVGELARSTGALGLDAEVDLRRDLTAQLRSFNYAHVQSRSDLASENNVQRQLGIDVVVLREDNGYFSCEFEITLFRHSVE